MYTFYVGYESMVRSTTQITVSEILLLPAIFVKENIIMPKWFQSRYVITSRASISLLAHLFELDTLVSCTDIGD